ncbi:MAG TPA: phosphatidate cytidylyltransferase, partial [Caldimonas sp.]
MLKQRILTAMVLLALLLPALIVKQAWPFAVLTMAAMALAGWEWARLNDAGALAAPLGIALGAACALALYAGWTTTAPRLAWWLAFLAWVLGGTWVLRAGVAGWPRLPRALRWAIGLVALWTAWLALANAKAIGLNFILSVFLLVWSADVFAYFGGRALGKRKLAPAISPGKSWEGVWSGMAGALLVAAAWLVIDAAGSIGTESFFSIAANRFGY